MLGQAEELTVQNPPGHAIPEVCQRAEDDAHVPAAVDVEEVRNIFQKEPAWLQFTGKPADLPEQSRTCISQARTPSRLRSTLAWEASGNESSKRVKSCGCEDMGQHLFYVAE